MRNYKKIFGAVLLIAAVFVVITAYTNISNQRSYVSVLKIPDVWKLKAVKQNWDEPVDVTTEELSESYRLMKLDYDGFYITVNENEYDRHGDDAVVNSFVVYSDKYRFTNKKIGVGSPKEDIVDLYLGKYTEISGLSSNECGYIIGRYWVYFDFDNNDTVEKISITDGI
ncbi:MAG: hypothetical protein LIO87_03490 [Eubacterium sp.]|nr:hypothetical protein [Eubacterium sp.]